MTIPSCVKVGSRVYSIRHDDETFKIMQDGDMSRREECAGLTRHDLCLIWLAPDSAAVVRKETLLHEIEHCLWSVSGLKKVLEQMRKYSDREEACVELLTGLRLQVVQENPEMYVWLSKFDEAPTSPSPQDAR